MVRNHKLNDRAGPDLPASIKESLPLSINYRLQFCITGSAVRDRRSLKIEDRECLMRSSGEWTALLPGELRRCRAPRFVVREGVEGVATHSALLHAT